ncbi:MAG TPA: hypothetical protein VFN42_12520 [Acetobacteraceae bacterium]|nr:hypothetical protein [Acetobacteraceae bacterium]
MSQETHLAVHVPAYAGTLLPQPRDRLRQLRKHLLESLRAERQMRDRAAAVGPAAPEPPAPVGEIAPTACALCQGWCCSKGGTHAYLDERTMARVRHARPELDAWGILRLYTRAAADPAYAGSCVFHGAQGCTLDRSLRSDLCNAYFCSGLASLVKQADVPGRVVLTAAKGTIIRTSVMTLGGAAHQ